jgi:DNA-binding beta-propeller fold protein YncE
MIRLTTTTKLMSAGIAMSLGWMVLEACACDETKEDQFPGFWVACAGNKPTLMTYSGNNPTIVTTTTAGNFNPDGWDCSRDSNSPQYKGSVASAPFPIGSPGGPGGNARPRQTGSSQAAYLPQQIRALPFTPYLPPPGAPPMCQSTFPDVIRTNHPESTVTRISTCPFAVKTTIPVFANPLQIAVTPDGSKALVTSYGPLDGTGGAITFINLNTNQVTNTVIMPFQVTPNGVAISPDGTTAYIGNFRPAGQSILVMNIASQTITATIPGVVTYPSGLTLTPDGSQLWIASPVGMETDVMDTLSQTLVARMNIQMSTDIAFNSTGTTAYVTSALNVPVGQVFAVNTGTFQTLTTYNVGNTPADIAMSYGDQWLVVDNSGDNTISVIDLVQDAVKTTNLGGVVNGIAFVH